MQVWTYFFRMSQRVQYHFESIGEKVAKFDESTLALPFQNDKKQEFRQVIIN